MKTLSALSLFCGAVVAASLSFAVRAQQAPDKAPDAPATGDTSDAPAAPFDRAWKDEGKWYFSWGYSRQQYAPSDIHVSQPSLDNDFTLHQVKASDYPGTVGDAVNSLFKLDFTSPQENVRIGYFLNPEKPLQSN